MLCDFDFNPSLYTMRQLLLHFGLSILNILLEILAFNTVSDIHFCFSHGHMLHNLQDRKLENELHVLYRSQNQIQALSAVCDFLHNFTFSSLLLLSEWYDDHTIVKIHVKQSAAKLLVADQTLICKDCLTVLITFKPRCWWIWELKDVNYECKHLT